MPPLEAKNVPSAAGVCSLKIFDRLHFLQLENTGLHSEFRIPHS